MGGIILFLAGMIKFLSAALKLLLIMGFFVGIFMVTIMATFEALHLVQPVDYVNQYGAAPDLFATDLWAWVVAVLGWTTIGYGISKMFAADKAETKRLGEINKY